MLVSAMRSRGRDTSLHDESPQEDASCREDVHWSRISEAQGVLLLFPLVFVLVVWGLVARALPRISVWSGGALVLVAATLVLYAARQSVGDG